MPQHNVRLTKVTSTHNNIRTQEIVGWCNDVPTPGESFQMFAPPLDPDAEFRMVTTTLVKSIEASQDPQGLLGPLVFRTQNSTYTLEFLQAPKE